jgi:hypothetical protein
MGGFGAVAAAGGTAAIRAVPDAVRAGRDIVRDRVAPVVRDLFDAPAQAGTTLTSGVGPVPRTAANEATDPAPVFFSAVSKAVDALPMEKGSAQQMRAMIAKSESVKPEEMAWTGLDDFLAGKKSVTKAEVQEYMQANEVKIEEVESGLDFEPKFREYTLPGGENYREVLLTLPEGQTPLNAYNKRLDEVAEAHGADNNSQGFQEYATPSEIEELAALQHAALNANDMDPVFRGGHFDEPNVLAHMRLNDRTGPNGEKILFIEEIQSDWHQKGRKGGYKTPGPRFKRPLKATEGVLSQGQVETNRAIGVPNVPNFYKITDADGKFVSYVMKADAANPDMAVKFATNRLLVNPPPDTRVPDAPLKKTWHEMSFRRVARMAAEEGYDAIGWTPGKMQARRYDLSKQISEIHLSGTDFKAFGLNGEMVIARTGVTSDDLPELIGKESADRLMSEKPKNGLRSLTGEQLEVGGEGMKGFYDKILKNYAAKWGKKFGSKVGVTKIARDYPEMADDQKLLDDLGVKATGSPYREIFSMPVTKKMRDSVLKKGVPLFGAAGVAGGAATSDTSERPNT